MSLVSSVIFLPIPIYVSPFRIAVKRNCYSNTPCYAYKDIFFDDYFVLAGNMGYFIRNGESIYYVQGTNFETDPKSLIELPVWKNTHPLDGTAFKTGHFNALLKQQGDYIRFREWRHRHTADHFVTIRQ